MIQTNKQKRGELVATMQLEKNGVTKKEIIELTSRKTGQRKQDVRVIVDTFFQVFIERLSNEGRIEVRNFGVFQVKETPARIGRNPMTKEEAPVPARRIVQFKAGKNMKEFVNQRLERKNLSQDGSVDSTPHSK